MEQEITVSKNIVSYFYNNLTLQSNSFEISETQKCYELLKQNFFISDSGKILFNELLNEINLIADEQKRNEFKNYLVKLFIDRIKIINYSLDNSEQKYFKLCNASRDKIYFDPDLKEDEINKTKIGLFNEGLNEVEIHCLKSFLSPDKESRFTNPSSKVIHSKTFEENKEYNLTNELILFLRDSKEIKYIDNYLANPNSRYHLENLIKSLEGKSEIIFVTLTKDANLENNKSDIDRAKLNYSELEKLIKKYNINIENIERSGHLERYIITDKYEISLPGGFDQFSRKGIPNINDKNKILKMFVERK